jgi:hypothetical protein
MLRAKRGAPELSDVALEQRAAAVDADFDDLELISAFKRRNSGSENGPAWRTS